MDMHIRRRLPAMNKHPPYDWSEDRIAELERLRKLGLTASQIAKELGDLSRHAVIGKLSRLGWSLKGAVGPRVADASDMNKRAKRNSPSGRAAQRRKKREIANRTNDTRAISSLIARAIASGELDPCMAVQSADMPKGPLLGLFELRDKHCRFPFGDVRSPGFGFCGKDRADSSTSYCAHHHQLCWQPVLGSQCTKNQMVLVNINQRGDYDGKASRI